MLMSHIHYVITRSNDIGMTPKGSVIIKSRTQNLHFLRFILRLILQLFSLGFIKFVLAKHLYPNLLITCPIMGDNLSIPWLIKAG